MAVVNERAVVSAFDMLERPVIRLPKVLGGLTFDQQIQKLFANGEQGFFYDPNDLSTMFQDAAGTIPVTDVGQPVGLMLDNSKGLVVGGELFNQTIDFSTWTKTAVVTNAIGNTFTTDGFGGCIKNPISTQMVVGKGYLVRVIGRSTVQFYLRASNVAEGRVFGGVGEFDITIKSPVTFADRAMYFQLQGAGTITVDSISIKELSGNHAFQTTSASRPILRQNAITGANYLEFDGTDDFLQTNNIDFTATDKVSLFTGVRKLSDALTGVVCELSASALNNGAFVLFAPAANGGIHYNFRSFGTTGGAAGTLGVLNFPAPHSAVLRAIGAISTSTCELLVNGGSKQSVSVPQGTGNYGNYPLYIGRRGGTSLPFNGHIYCLIGVGKLVSDSETAAIEKELAKRTGVSLIV